MSAAVPPLTPGTDELEFLEDVHMWRVVKVSASYFEAVFDARIRVAIPCHEFRPLASSVQLTRLKNAPPARKDWFPAYNDLVLRAAAQRVASRQAVLRHSRDVGAASPAVCPGPPLLTLFSRSSNSYLTSSRRARC
jgi:hypothetical protein